VRGQLILYRESVMPASITLAIVKGELKGQKFVFSERTTCLIGRNDDCHPRLPMDKAHATVSRHHCLLDINPPDIRVRDFGSRNGTFVNGKKIGQRGEGMTPEQGARMAFPEVDLKAGDEIRLGETIFQVGVFLPVVCADCSAEIPEDQKAVAEASRGVYQCIACRFRTRTLQNPQPPRVRARVCTQCGRDVSDEVSEQRQGEFICNACKTDPTRITRHLLELSEAGDENLVALQGYTIVRELGRGGMGAVYLARHGRTGEQVALKVMLPRIAADENAKQMFLREVESTRALHHPNVVWLRDAGCSQGIFFFTLEYCDGGSLDQLVRHGRPLAVGEAAPLILEALDGLEYAHNVFGSGKGLVHRDLKPHNLFLSGSHPSRVCKVGDYGLAKAFDTAGLSGLTRSGAVLGTPVFMPRQQVINFKYARPEVDVWAMAASFYYLLTGKSPRDFPQGMDWWLAVLQCDAVPIRQRDASIPKKLAGVIDRALIDQPAIPFKSAVEFKTALEGALP
jgi:pSer/pThr/pTyr-binding forkhead associated (FHA) protein